MRQRRTDELPSLLGLSELGPRSAEAVDQLRPARVIQLRTKQAQAGLIVLYGTVEIAAQRVTQVSR